jgi:hypothetical protein
VPGPDQRRRERAHVGIGRDAAQVVLGGEEEEEAIMAAASVRTGDTHRRGRARPGA